MCPLQKLARVVSHSRSVQWRWRTSFRTRWQVTGTAGVTLRRSWCFLPQSLGWTDCTHPGSRRLMLPSRAPRKVALPSPFDCRITVFPDFTCCSCFHYRLTCRLFCRGAWLMRLSSDCHRWPLQLPRYVLVFGQWSLTQVSNNDIQQWYQWYKQTCKNTYIGETGVIKH